MPTIYVLQCERNRYYIGKTDRRLKDRVEEHFHSSGSEWTRTYKPIKVIEVKQNADDFDEDKYTKIYMKKFGIDKVRGGTYTQMELPEYQLRTLEKELCGASDLCYRCNRTGHFASTCYAKTKADGSLIDEDTSDSEYGEFWCCEYCDKEFDTEFEANKHEKTCKKKKLFNTISILNIAQEVFDDKPKKQTCYRCGRHGHYANNCYASNHINGKKLY